MHECPSCGMACDCDNDDLWYDRPPVPCACDCEDVGEDDDWCDFCMGDGCPECIYDPDADAASQELE